jgi:3-oxoacyl-[acyl-carrier protein] reductase
VVITGGSRGIGQAVAEAFYKAGDNVTILDREVASERGPGTGERYMTVQADVTSSADVDRAFEVAEERFGPVEVLVANAGVVRDKLIIRMSDEDFAATRDVNLTGSFYCVRRAAKSMVRRKSGAVILLGSVVASIGGSGQANYSASKAALVGLARSVARELGPRGITANVIAPGFIQTDMTAALPEAVREQYLSQIPAGRFGTVEDVAGAALFLAGARYVSGAILPVDGALGMGH